MKMMMILVIILMLDDDNAQKTSTTMTLWSKYTPFKYYYLVKKGPNQPDKGRPPPTPNARLKTFFSFGRLPLHGSIKTNINSINTALIELI